jgi:hypothetical protein
MRVSRFAERFCSFQFRQKAQKVIAKDAISDQIADDQADHGAEHDRN